MKRKEGWQTKVMPAQNVKQNKNFAAQNSWQWLRRGSSKRQTESLIIAVQEQALGTNNGKTKVEHSRESVLRKTKNEHIL